MVAIWNLQLASTRKMGVARYWYIRFSYQQSAPGLHCGLALHLRRDILDHQNLPMQCGRTQNHYPLRVLSHHAQIPPIDHGKTTNKPTYHQSAYANGYGLTNHNGRRSNQFSDPIASNNATPWLNSEDHETGFMRKTKANYHNQGVRQTCMPRPARISKVEPVANLNCGVPENSIWNTNTARVDRSLVPERGGHEFV